MRTPATQHIDTMTSTLIDAGRHFDGRYFWHRSASPYVVLVAEFFLRRTNRVTVSRYLPAFLERFPTPKALACAEPADVVEAAFWAGLRRRTSHLPEVVRLFVSRESWDAEALRELPYIGPYAAEAIALYGFGEPAFPVDNNVRRLFSRYFGVTEESLVQDLAAKVCSEALASGGIAAVRAAHLGALALGWETCRTPPKCTVCPLRSDCPHAARGARDDSKREATFDKA